MIYRQLTEELLKWSERDNRKPLVLRGARQVGKTTLVNELGKKYDVYIKLNLEKSSDAEIFAKSDNVKEIYQYICLKKKIKVDEGKRTLLFIDEIQNEPKAVGLLRYFYEEMPWLHIIAAGSRLQTLIKQRISFPVVLVVDVPVCQKETLALVHQHHVSALNGEVEQHLVHL